MSVINFYPHQQEALENAQNQNRVAFYHDM